MLGIQLWLCLAFATVALGHTHEPFKAGDKIPVDCRDPRSQEWGWKFGCEETGEPLTLQYAKEELVHCTLKLESQEQYRWLEELVQQKTALQCRLPMSVDKHFWLPFSMSILGLVEPGHMHINLHQSIVVHAHGGMIMGVGAYPIRDRFQMVTRQTPINFHSTVRWFDRHSHKSLHSHSHQHSGSISFVTIMVFILLTTVVNVAVGGIWYRWHVQPKLRRADLKID